MMKQSIGDQWPVL